jgi:alkylhydroperoxidase/carboxymuconolactone decarboxylase family protein YurZ
MLFHFDHSLVANQFFLRWVARARECGVRFEWKSELECQSYFREGAHWHHFLPDGQGDWISPRQRFQFALEIDRTRESNANLSRKFNDYFAATEVASAGALGRAINLLVVTTSWKRAETIRQVVRQMATLYMSTAVRLWVTTFEEVTAGNITACIWHSLEPTKSKERLPCFQGESAV